MNEDKSPKEVLQGLMGAPADAGPGSIRDEMLDTVSISLEEAGIDPYEIQDDIVDDIMTSFSKWDVKESAELDDEAVLKAATAIAEDIKDFIESLKNVKLWPSLRGLQAEVDEGTYQLILNTVYDIVKSNVNREA